MTIKTNEISEYSPAAGVTIDGVLIKDGNVDGADVSALATASHAAVTLAADADVLLGLTGQQLTFDPQTANRVFAGPASGGAVDPTFRALVTADLPDLSALKTVPSTNVVWVDPKGAGYTTLSAALAAITDASDSNEYLILVAGEVAETATIVAKSHVHVLFLAGASVTVSSTAGINAVNFTTLSNTTWAAVDGSRPTIIRDGVIASGAVHAISMGTCASTVGLFNIYAKNAVTGANTCHGILINSASHPTLANCTAVGADANICYGILINLNSNPTLTNCTAVGGNGGMNCYGMQLNFNCNPVLTNCTIIGGSGGAVSYGLISTGGSNPTLRYCTIIGGSGGIQAIGLYVNANSAMRATDCLVMGGGGDYRTASATVTASSRQEDTFRPIAAHPYRLVVAVTVNVSAAAAAGVTLTLRDATGGGGNALTDAIDVASTGTKYAAITGHRTIAAAGNVYARLSSSDATLAYTISYQYTVEYVQCYALYNTSALRQDYINCVFASNAESPAAYVATAGNTASVFVGGVAKSGLNSGTRQKAFVCQSAWNPGQVYNMTLDGGSTNLTAAAGTANGTNVEL